MHRIPLHVSSIDLGDEATLDLLGQHLSDLSWQEVGGRVIATLHVDCENPVGVAVQAARRIVNHLRDAVVEEVDQDLVNISDIASRVGISREAVRLWADGQRGPGGFPPAAGTIGGSSSKIWRWATVNAWLQRNYGLGDSEQYLTSSQVAEVNAALLRFKQEVDSEWEAFTQVEQRQGLYPG